MKKYNISIIGCTGLVGMCFLKILEESKIQIDNLFLYASYRSKDKIILFRNREYKVLELNNNTINNVDFTFCFANKKVAKQYLPLFEERGSYVIDNSAYFRLEDDIPLIVPEINFEEIFNFKRKIISNPNCATIQSVVPLKIVDDLFSLTKIVYNTYQSISGGGQSAIDEFNNIKTLKITNIFDMDVTKTCIPKIGKINENGDSEEELKMICETQKILNKKIDIYSTCVRVPVERCHGVSIYVETAKEVNINLLKETFRFSESIIVVDELYPNSITSFNNNYVYVGRIRKGGKNSLLFYVVSDNIRKGAAYNAFQIFNKIISYNE